MTVPKATGNSMFLGNKQDAINDLAEINNGQAVRTGEKYLTSSGRTWGTRNGTVYPIEGPDVISMTSQEYKLLTAAQNEGVDKAMQTMAGLEKAKQISPGSAEKVLNLLIEYFPKN